MFPFEFEGFSLGYATLQYFQHNPEVIVGFGRQLNQRLNSLNKAAAIVLSLVGLLRPRPNDTHPGLVTATAGLAEKILEPIKDTADRLDGRRRRSFGKIHGAVSIHVLPP